MGLCGDLKLGSHPASDGAHVFRTLKGAATD